MQSWFAKTSAERVGTDVYQLIKNCRKGFTFCATRIQSNKYEKVVESCSDYSRQCQYAFEDGSSLTIDMHNSHRPRLIVNGESWMN